MANKQARTLLIFGGIAALLYYISTRTAALISFGSPSMRIHKVTLTELEIRVNLPVINQSDVPAPVTAFLGNIFYQNSNLGTLTLVNPVQLPGFGQTTLEFRLVSGLFGTAYELLNILTKGNPLNWQAIDYKNVDWSQFTVKGTLKVKGIPVPVNTKLLG